MNHKIMRAWDAGRNKVRYVYYDKETKRTNIGEEKFEWYFFVNNKDYEKYQSMFALLQEQRKINKCVIEKYYTKIYVDREHKSDLLDKNCDFVWEYCDRTYYEVKKILEEHKIQTYEADILPYRRWTIDMDIGFESEMKCLFLDLETDDEKLTGKVDPGSCHVLSCAFLDPVTKKEAWLCARDRSDEAEKELLEKIARVIVSYHVLIAWNGKGFDFPVLKLRMMKYGIQLDWRKIFLQDHMEIFKKLGPQLPSYSLDFVAKEVTKKGKLEHEEKIFQMFLNNRPLLKEYNLVDVRSMDNIETITKFLSVAREVNVIGKCPCDDIYISRKIDNLLLQRVYARGHFHFKTKVKQVEVEEDDEPTFEGAYVFSPKIGLHHNVDVVDFHALYVTMMQSFNLSPDSIIEDVDLKHFPDHITTPNGFHFKKEFIGIIPEIIMEINEKRNKYKALMKECSDKSSIEYKTYDRLAYVFKFFSLSFYGVMGLRTSRFYDVRIAESTTLSGQFFTKHVATYLESIGVNILYGDTDSLFIKNNSKYNLNQIVDQINVICKDKALKQFNCKVSHISIEHDKTFKKLILLKAKKRYFGILVYLDGKEVPEQLYLKGLEYVRTDSCKLLKTKQKEIMNICLEEKVTENEMRDMIFKLRNFVLYELNDIDQIKIAQKLTKEIEDYKTYTAHLKVVEALRASGIQIYVGDKIEYFVETLDKDGKPVPKAVRFFNGKFDRLYFWSNKLYPALERVLESVYRNTDWAKYRDFGSAKKMATSKQGRMDLWSNFMKKG